MLVVFDLDGTLIRSFLREGQRHAFDDVEVLPGRVRALLELRRRGVKLAVATNQGGVAHGYQTQQQVWEKVARVRRALWQPELPVFASFSHPDRPRVPLEKPPGRLDFPRIDPLARKPGPGLIFGAIQHHRTVRQATVMVGDMDTDREAADAAGVEYLDVAAFFDAS